MPGVRDPAWLLASSVGCAVGEMTAVCGPRRWRAAGTFAAHSGGCAGYGWLSQGGESFLDRRAVGPLVLPVGADCCPRAVIERQRERPRRSQRQRGCKRPEAAIRRQECLP